MSLDEQLLDFAQAAHELRRAGYSEAQIARAAGFPDLPTRIHTPVSPRDTPTNMPCAEPRNPATTSGDTD